MTYMTEPQQDGRNFAEPHRWAIVGKWPFCHGCGGGRPLCAVCDYKTSCILRRDHRFNHHIAETDALRGFLRVYARENHALRKRNDVLEWLRECEALPVGIVDWHPYFMTEAERPTARAFDDAMDEIAASIAAARAAVEVPHE